MEDFRGIESKDTTPIDGVGSSNIKKQRRKPGPKKTIALRSEKESCRLTKEEKAERRAYCKKYGIKPADLLRAAYLSATISEMDRLKVIFDAATMLRELDATTSKIKEQLDDDDRPVTSTDLSKINKGIVVVLKRLIMFLPVPMCSASLLAMLNTSVDAGFDPAHLHGHKIQWLIGFIIGAAIDLALLPFILPYQRKLDRWIARNIWKLFGGPQKQRRFAEERRRYVEQDHLPSRSPSK